MRICIITKYIPPLSTDGIPRNRWEYARQFVALGHEVHIITSGLKGVERIEDGIFIHEVPAWEQDTCSRLFTSPKYDDLSRGLLRYSYLVYERIKQLHNLFPIDIIDSPLWDIEGYVTKIRLPHIPMVVRLETTSMLLKEILQDKTPEKERINEIETHFMAIADGFVFDSWSILEQTERLYSFDFNYKQYAVIHHGIDIEVDEGQLQKRIRRNDTGKLKIISVGRLEKRKGSDILVKTILPEVLKNLDIEVHLVGKDSGEWDGFKEANGIGYHDYLKKNLKKYLNTQLFIHGYVSDGDLDQLYEEADIVLALSRYESFGLLYTEAMKKGKPLIVFNTGSVPEIFEDGKDAVIVPLETPEKVVDAIYFLKDNPGIRKKLACGSKEKLVNHFQAKQMGEKCAAFFEDLVYKKGEERTFQVMNCLTGKDGVSNTTIRYDRLLKENGLDAHIIGTWATEEVKNLLRPIEEIKFQESDLVIYHYWNYCEKGHFFNKLFLPKKVLFFHNFTTPNFFDKDDPAYTATSNGFAQLPSLSNFDVYVCHTEYSANIIKQSVKKPVKTFIIPPIVEKQEIWQRAYNREIATKKKPFHLIFVSSIAPHKKQTDLVNFFHHYLNNYNSDARLTIIGSGTDKYVAELKDAIRRLQIERQVTLTGKVSDEDLYGYYRSADMYLSMCEHEGFGIPLAEAMAFELPVAAFNCTAIPDTVGDNGLLFENKNFDLVSKLVEKVRTDSQFRDNVIQRQNIQLNKFSISRVRKLFKELDVLAHENQRKRISSTIHNGQTSIEETLFHNDSRITKNGAIFLRDGHRLFIDSNTENGSCIHVEDTFDDFEVNFFSHPWSGKVNLSVNGYPEQEFDLYSPEGKIKSVKLDTKIGNGLHKITIKPSGNKNTFAHSNEVYLESITLFKNYRPQLKYITRLADNEPEELHEDEQEVADDNCKYLNIIHEIRSTDVNILYQGSWNVKDRYFKFADGQSKSNYFEFTAMFSSLDLVFISHAWSGKIRIHVDGSYTEYVNLYNPNYCEKKFQLKKRFQEKEHHVIVKAEGTKDRNSQGYEIFFKEMTLHRKVPINVDNDTLSEKYKVSVVINTYNRASHLEALLKELTRQAYPFYEIIVVNGPSTDDTEKVLQQYSGKIKILQCPEANLSRSRNIGIENSAGHYIAFIDDDALPCNEKWIENFIYFIIFHSDKKIGTIGGPVKHKDTDHYEFKNGATSDYGFQIFREEEITTHSLDGKRWVQGVPGGNNIVAKDALYEIGGFDERFIYYLDETDMCIRLARKGYAIINNPLNYIRHFKAPSNIRKSTFEIRWDIIARSDTFYSMKNGHDLFIIRLFKTIQYYRTKHFRIEIGNAYKHNKITRKDYQRYKRMLRKGFWEGLKWGISKSGNCNYLKNTRQTFLLFNNGDSSN